MQNEHMPTTLDELIEHLDNAQSYEEWVETSKKIDTLESRVPWQRDDSSPLYEYKKIRALLVELRQARLQGNLPKLLYLVRTTFSRNVGNMGDPRLFNYAQSGTKYLVDEFINECELVLQTLVTQTDDAQASEVLNTLVQTRKAFGRTALVFSGGSILGFLHVGVTRELIERNLLPRIISGSSAGSIFASMLCIHRDEEFDRMWELLNIPMSIFGPFGENESFMTHIKRVLTAGTWIDSTYLKEMMQGLIGDVTFQEAYNRTGRILNVTVSVVGTHDMPRLLNYLTAPNVIIWSAVVCSCSVPFVFAADSIMAKNPKTKAVYPWSNRAFIDGSVDNDMPLTRLSEMFNVNHFVASQVNPHVAPLFTSDRGSPDVEYEKGRAAWSSPENESTKEGGSGWISTILMQGMKSGRSLLLNEVEHGLSMMKAVGITPSIASTLLNVLGQEYWGDITIVPPIHLSDVGHLLQNPTYEQIEDLISRGRKATWPKLALIRNHCAIELALDKAIVDLRSRVIATVFSPMRTKSSLSLQSPNGRHNHLQRSFTSIRRSKTHVDPMRSQSTTSLALTRPRSSRSFSQLASRRRASVDFTAPASRRSSDGL